MCGVGERRAGAGGCVRAPRTAGPLPRAPGGPASAPPRPRWSRPRPPRAARSEAAAGARGSGDRPTAERCGEGRAGWGGRPGAPGRKRRGLAGVAADMCRMSFKVSAAGSGRECRAGRKTSGGGPAPGELPGWLAPRGPQDGVSAALDAGGGRREGTGLVWLLWLVVWRCGLCLKGFRYLRPQSEGAAGTVAGVTGGGGEEARGQRSPVAAPRGETRAAAPILILGPPF